MNRWDDIDITSFHLSNKRKKQRYTEVFPNFLSLGFLSYRDALIHCFDRNDFTRGVAKPERNLKPCKTLHRNFTLSAVRFDDFHETDAAC